MSFPIGIGAPLNLAASGFPTLDLLQVAPALPLAKPTAGLPVDSLFAQWDFGPDAGSLASVSSSHQLSVFGSPVVTYTDGSLNIGAGNARGFSVPIADALTARTFWGVFRIDDGVGSLATLFGNHADSSIDATSGTGLTRGSGSMAVQAPGANNAGGISLPNAPGSFNFFGMALDAQGGGHAMLGGIDVTRLFGKALGTATIGGVPAANDTIGIGANTITFVTGSPAAGQVQVGATATATAAALAAYINANTAALGVEASASGAVVTIATNVGGATGNGMALTKSAAAITLSGATLAGGTPRVVSSRLPAIGQAYSSYYNQQQTLAEFGYTPQRLSLVQMQALYAETKARLALRGITVR